MIPQDNLVEQEGDLGGEIVEMSIDQNSFGHIMSVLTTLYSDREMAVIREYATNARDSHIEAGKEHVPIEVLTPSPFDPRLVIRDQGIGMSLEDIKDIYIRYGASTKRHTNEQTGTLGLGCKSGLCYTHELSLVAVKDHWRTVVAISRTTTGAGAVEIISHAPTMEQNGVTIAIPQARAGDFTTKVHEFFSFWREGEVTIDGQPPVSPDGRKLGDNIILRNIRSAEAQNTDDVLVMGGVPYRVPRDKNLFTPPNTSTDRWGQPHCSLICWVKMGSVTFTPSREALYYTEQTERTLKALRHEIENRIRHLIERDLLTAPTPWDALLAAKKWRDEGGVYVEKPAYKELAIPDTWRPAGISFSVDRYSYSNNGRAYYGRISSISVDEFLKYNVTDLTLPPQIIIGMPKKFTVHGDLDTNVKVKIRTWAKVHGVMKAFAFHDHPDSYWLTGLRTVHWDEVKQARLPRASRNYEGEYSLMGFDGQPIKMKNIPATTQLLYVDGIEDARKVAPGLKNLRRWRGPDAPEIMGVVVPPFRLAKLKRLRPTSKPFLDLYQEMMNEQVKTIKRFNWQALKLSHYDKKLLLALVGKGVKHPKILELMEVANGRVDRRLRNLVEEYYSFHSQVGYHNKLDREKFDENYYSELEKEFPLLNHHHTVRERTINHYVLYLNAVWEVERKTAAGKLLELEYQAGLALQAALQKPTTPVPEAEKEEAA